MQKKKLLYFTILVISLTLIISGCSNNQSVIDNENTNEDLILTELNAVSGNELKATFDNGETMNITEFNPKPLDLGEKTEVQFTHNGTTYSDEVTYVIKITGTITTSQPSNSISTSAFNKEDISKVVLFMGEDYKISEVTNGTFTVTLDKEEPGGIAFLDSENNYMGYLSLPDGLSSFPTDAISEDTGEIDLGEISFTEDGVGSPSEDPFKEMSTDTKSVLAVAGSFFGAVLRSPKIKKKMVNNERKFTFGLMYFPYANVINENGVGSLRDGNQIATHRLGIGFDPKYSNFENIIVDYPSNEEGLDQIFVTQEKIDSGEASSDGVKFAGVGNPDKARFAGPEIPPTGKYQISSGNDFNFTLTMPDVQKDAQNNLVFPVPTINFNNEGILESIEWEYKNKNGYVVDKPSDIIENIDIQINAVSSNNSDLKGNYDFTEHGPTRIYNSGKLEGKITQYDIGQEKIYWEDIANINMAYTDIYDIHYVTSFSKE